MTINPGNRSGFSLPESLPDSNIIRKPISAVHSFLTQSLTSSAKIFVISATQVSGKRRKMKLDDCDFKRDKMR